MKTIRNTIIFLSLAAIFAAIYFFYIKPSSDTPALTSSTTSSSSASSPLGTSSTQTGTNGNVAQDFLNLLLSVKSIKLNDAIFSDAAFATLDGSHSIILTPDGTEGRPNPFAPFSADTVPTPPAGNQKPGV